MTSIEGSPSSLDNGEFAPFPQSRRFLHRVPRVNVVELKTPVALANFPRLRQRCGGVNGAALPTIERGTTPGVPFDQCSLSTVDSGSSTSHRRRKKYTTTTVTTTTITKIMLPHMRQVVLFDDTNTTDSNTIRRVMEGERSDIMPNQNGSLNTEAAGTLNNVNQNYAFRPVEDQPPDSVGVEPNVPRLPIAMANRRQPHSLPSVSNSTAPQTPPPPLRSPHVEKGELAAYAGGALSQMPTGDTGQQPWVISNKTASMTSSVTHRHPAVKPFRGNGSQQLSTNPSTTLQPNGNPHQVEEPFLVEPQEAATPPHSRHLRFMDTTPGEHNTGLGEPLMRPWILNEERDENEWHAVG
ncbi:hypothetical protein DQ04_15301010 [Trypanosoma grayi]|uniref:hypothetical protein n=1 Tax=Trypanosoma grayi TaxID=71804 RepID=UPI0004F46AA7|nr:hypothetical protein DQ04_15301010 [Trypanosoma grayi]KEG06201.1 hypothetical protein DQ04_15301010 [Trypanosoma grayi]